MAEFYEFHDSILTGIERQPGHLILKLKAYRHSWPDGVGEGTGTGCYQPIEIAIEEGTVEPEIPPCPIWILEGTLTADDMQAAPDDLVGAEIPASLMGSGSVVIQVGGIHEETHESFRIVVRGESARIIRKETPAFTENL